MYQFVPPGVSGRGRATGNRRLLASFALLGATAIFVGSGSLSAMAASTITATSTGTVLTALPGIPTGAGSSTQGVAADGTNLYVSDSAHDLIDVFSLGGVAGTPITLASGTFPTDLALSPDGSTLYATGDFTSTVERIDLATSTDTSFPVAMNPHGVVVSADGSIFYVIGNSDAQVHSYNASTGAALNTSVTNGLYATPNQIALSPDGTKVYVTYRDPIPANPSGGLRILNASDLTETTHVDLPNALGVAVESTGDVVVGTGNGAAAQLVELSAAGVPTNRSVTVGQSDDKLLVSPDGSTVYVADSTSGNLYVLDTATFTTPASPGTVDQGRALAVTPDGLHVYAAGGGTSVLPFAVAKLTLTAPATVTPGTGPTAFNALITDGQSPVGDYSGGSVLVEILDSANAVVASGTGAPGAATGTASVPINLSTLPIGSYSVRATLVSGGGTVQVLASGFTVAAAAPALAATGVDAAGPLIVTLVVLFAGVALLIVGRRRSRRGYEAVR